MPQTHDNDQITLLIFKDNQRARTLRVPLRWISRLGFFLGLILGAALIAAVLAAKFYRTSKSADPQRVRSLEAEISELNETIATMTAASAQKENIAEPQTDTKPDVAPSPQKQIVTPLISTGSPPLFQALPNEYSVLSNDGNLPIRLTGVRTRWIGSSLKIRFNINYLLDDGNSQKGYIVILARGKNALLAYPSQVLQTGNSKYLIDPSRGESFSVGRIRPTEAIFRPVQASQRVKDLQVLIFNEEKQLILQSRFPAPRRRTTPKPTTTEPQAPKTESGASQPSSTSESQSQ